MLNLPESKFEKKRLKTIFRQSNVALPGNLFVVLCVAVLFWQKIQPPYLTFWLIAMALVLLGRFIIYLKYKALKKEPLNPKPWFLMYGISIFANGALWGIFGFYANFNLPFAYLAITLIILAGLVAASVATNSVSVPIFFGFAFPTLLPVGIALLLNDGFEHVILGFLLISYLALLTQAAIQLNKVILKSLTYRYEKLQLLDDLQKEKAQVMDLNKQLGLDIEKRKQTEKEKELLISELQKALHEVKTLSGLIPICAQCKKVRDDKGYWNQIESYIHKHSDVDFSHSICPKCAEELYPGMDIYKD
jgi:hypothetical protein